MRSAAVNAGELDVCISADGLTLTTATARPAVSHFWHQSMLLLCDC